MHGPVRTIEGRDASLEFMKPMTGNGPALKIVKTLGQGAEAAIWYEMAVGDEPVRCCDGVRRSSTLAAHGWPRHRDPAPGRRRSVPGPAAAQPRESPLAFSDSLEDELRRPIEEFRDELGREADPPEDFVLGAFESAGALVGFVRFRRDRRTKARHKAMIHAMYVDATHRAHGIGKALIDRVLGIARRLEGLEQIHLWVLHAGTSARGFYERCGFVSQGTRVAGDLKIGDVYVDAEYMVLSLLPS